MKSETASRSKKTSAQNAKELARLLELMKSGMMLDELSVAVLPRKSDRELIRRAALMRRFDRRSLAEACPKTEFSTAFENVTAGSAVESLDEGVFQLPAEVRQRQLEEEWTVHRKGSQLFGKNATLFRLIHGRLEKHFARRRDRGSWKREWLHHALIAEPAEAVAHAKKTIRSLLPDFERDKTPQYEHLQLARAFEWIEVLDRQSPYLDNPTRVAADKLRRKVETWEEWGDQYCRSLRYVDREVARTEAENLLFGSGEVRVLELHAAGGIGKTMFLRWLITRMCVPNEIPVAHIDFDRFLHQRPEPWQLLIHCARQLDRQFAGVSPFQGFLKEAEKIEKSLTASGSGASESLGDRKGFDSFGKDLVNRFVRILKKTRAKAPRVLVVIDTLEEVMFRHQKETPKILGQFLEVVEKCPNVRLILSGREAVSDSSFLKALEREGKSLSGIGSKLELKPFEPKESRQFLSDYGLEDVDEELMERAARVSEGIPFLLTLIADLIDDAQQKGESHEAVLGKLVDKTQIKLVYLIDRIVRRIQDEGVRWVLRYGVVPRELTRDFMVEVILPFIKNVEVHGWRVKNEAGELLDAPEKDTENLPDGLKYPELYFAKGKIPDPDDRNAIDQLWKNLNQYATRAAWIESGFAGDRLKFIDAVREPMRQLLRDQPIDREIHRKAIEFFRNPEHGDSLEENYHRFQYRGPSAGEAWRQTVKALVESDKDPEKLYQFCDDLLGPDFIDGETGTPHLWRHPEKKDSAAEPLVADADLEFAQWAKAWAAHDLARLEENDSARQGLLEEAENLLTELSESTDKPVEIKFLKWEGWALSAQLVATESFQVVEKLERHLASNPGPRSRRALAEARLLTGDQRCVELFRQLLKDSPPDSPFCRYYLRSLLIALERFGGTGEDFKAVSDQSSHLDKGSSKLVLDLWVSLGDHQRADSAALKLESIADRRVADQQIESLRGTSAPVGSSSSSPKGRESLALAESCRNWLMLKEAGQWFQQAQRQFHDAGQLWHSGHAHLSQVETLIYDSGDIREAGRGLQEITRSHFRSPRQLGLQAEYYRRSGEFGDPVDYIREALKSAKSSDSLAALRAAALGAFIVLEPSELEKMGDSVGEIFHRWLSRLPSRASRGRALLPLRHARGRLEVDWVDDLLLDESPDYHCPAGEIGIGHWFRVTERPIQAISVTSGPIASERNWVWLREAWILERLVGRATEEAMNLRVEMFESMEKDLEHSPDLRFDILADHAEFFLDAGRANLARKVLGDGKVLKECQRAPLGIQTRIVIVEARLNLESDPDWAHSLADSAVRNYESLGDLERAEAFRTWWKKEAADSDSRDWDNVEKSLESIWHTDGEDISYLEAPGHVASGTLAIDSFDSLIEPLLVEPAETTRKMLEDAGAQSGFLRLGILSDEMGGVWPSIPWELDIEFRRTGSFRTAPEHRRKQLRTLWLQRALNATNFDGPVLLGSIEEFSVDYPIAEDGAFGLQTLEALASYAGSSSPRLTGKLVEKLANESWNPKREIRVAAVGSAEQMEHTMGNFAVWNMRDDIDFEWFRNLPPELAIHEFEPDILHIFGSYREDLSSGRVLPDYLMDGKFGGDEIGFDDGALPIRPPALILLDGPPGFEPGEQIRQLLCRNAYAADLFNRIDCPHILALGHDAEFPAGAYEALAGIADGVSLGEILRRVRLGERADFETPEFDTWTSETTHFASALWTADPELPFIPNPSNL